MTGFYLPLLGKERVFTFLALGSLLACYSLLSFVSIPAWTIHTISHDGIK